MRTHMPSFAGMQWSRCKRPGMAAPHGPDAMRAAVQETIGTLLCLAQHWSTREMLCPCEQQGDSRAHAPAMVCRKATGIAGRVAARRVPVRDFHASFGRDALGRPVPAVRVPSLSRETAAGSRCQATGQCLRACRELRPSARRNPRFRLPSRPACATGGCGLLPDRVQAIVYRTAHS